MVERVIGLLRGAGMMAGQTADARATCRLSEGYVGQRPGFAMRYITGDLGSMPDQIKLRLASGGYRMAAVGACPAQDTHGFSGYSIAVLLYR